MVQLSARLVSTLPAALVLATLTAVAAAATPAPTRTTLTVSPASVVAGSPVTLSAQVVSGGEGVPAGTVLFCNASAAHCEDAAVLGQAQLTSKGVAQIHLRLAPGAYSVAALFQGAPHAPRPVAPSVSPAETLTVTGLATTSTTAQATGVAGNFTLPSTVTALGVPAPTGSVSFRNQTTGGALLASVPLSSTHTTLQYTALPPLVFDGLPPIALADLNGDGILDKVVANQNGNALTVLLGNGDGTFTSTWTLSNSLSATALAIADVTGDGIPDILLGISSSVSNGFLSLQTLNGRGDGTFTAFFKSDLQADPLAITLADFNGDGLLDAAVVAYIGNNSNAVMILLGDGTGGFFGTGTDTSLSSPEAITSADFNGDGIPDLAITNVSTSPATQNSLTIRLGNGDGTFRTSATLPTGINPQGVVAADFNGDGSPDLAVANVNDTFVSVFLGKGDGTFTAAPPVPVQGGTPSISATDQNGDGIPDLVAGSPLAVYLGKGDGTFHLAMQLPEQVSTFTTGDLNNDGLSDIVTENGVSLGRQVTTVVASNVNLSMPGGTSIIATYSGDLHYAASSAPALSLSNSTAAPVFHPAPAIYPDVQNVTITDATPGAVIFYTLDGSIPTANATRYTGAIRATNQTTIKAIALLSGASSSPVVTAVYLIRLPVPTFTPQPGVYPAPLTISILADPTRCASGPCTIDYTLDGTTPTPGSTLYTGPLTFTAPGIVTIRAIVVAPDHVPSAPATATYFIASTATIALTGSPSTTVAAGTTLNLTAQVLSSGSPVPHGQVVFCNATVVPCSVNTTPFNHPDILGEAQVVNGVAVLPVRLPVGTTVVRAIFQGTPRTPSPVARVISAAVNVVTTGAGRNLTTTIIPRAENGIYSFRNTVQAFGVLPVTGTVTFSDSLNGATPLALGSATLNSAISTVNFTPAPSANTAPSPFSIASGDFNRDGISDLVVAGESGVEVLLANGDGTFRAPQPVPGAAVGLLLVADATGDGLLDIISADQSDQGAVVVVPGRGDGTFGAPVIVVQQPDISAAVVADVNGDGIPDLVTTSSFSTLGNAVTTSLGRGDGSFAAPKTMRVSGQQGNAVLADLNGDGLPDLALLNFTSAGESVLSFLGNGDGTFTAKSSLPLSPLVFVHDLALGDLNGDGTPDLVVSGQDLTVLLGNGDGTFHTGITLSGSQENYSEVQLADFDSNGTLDIATRFGNTTPAGTFTDSLLLLRGNGDGTFQTLRAPVLNSPLGPLTLGDFDGSGVPDVAYADSGRSFVRALLTEQSTLAAIVNITLPGPGTNTITATYSGSAAYMPSTSAPLVISTPTP